MRNRAGELLCVTVIIFSLPVLTGCKKEVKESNNAPMMLSIIPGNLVVDGTFTAWNGSGLKDWETTAPVKNIIVKDGGGLRFSGDASGPFYVYQRISVDQGKFYKATVNVSYTINNYFSAGLYIMDSTLKTILGKFERTYSSSSGETWEVVFHSQNPTQVAVALGFLEGINADVIFDNMAVTEYSYPTTIVGSDFATHLSQRFPLAFSADQFDSTVTQLSEYVNTVLLCRYAYYADTTELPILDALIGSDSNYSYFNSYLHSLDQIQTGYCQKSSLSLSEILTNEFHIPTKQTHMVFGGIGEHQFTEYWNAFAGKWIAIDPCFNTRYIKNGVLMGVEEFDRSEAPMYMQYFGSHYYYPDNSYLTWFWQNMDNLMITDYYTISYPYTP